LFGREVGSPPTNCAVRQCRWVSRIRKHVLRQHDCEAVLGSSVPLPSMSEVLRLSAVHRV
jgi:hypothetical protein